MKFEELSSKVIDWAEARGIFENGDALAQLDKTEEELNETIHAVKEYNGLSWRGLDTPQKSLEAAENEVADGVGDMLVTIIIAAKMMGLDTTECLELAYNEIKDRTGKMVGGQFVKDK